MLKMIIIVVQNETKHLNTLVITCKKGVFFVYFCILAILGTSFGSNLDCQMQWLTGYSTMPFGAISHFVEGNLKLIN